MSVGAASVRSVDVSRTYPQGVPCWVDVEQPDLAVATDFYGGLFGWTFTDAMPPGAGGHYLIATYEGRDVAAIAPGGGGPWTTYIAVDSADEAVAAVTAAGGDVVETPEDAGPGGRTATVRDPQGATFRLWQARNRPGAQLVNVPGAWNFSDLHTTDPAAALAFYAAVFGWQAAGFAGHEESGGMVKVPGYGDHLAATSDPGIHERQTNAPAGFADVIGAIVPAAAGEPAHWHVTFSVADRDEGTATVERLGGSVLSTTESMWARLAVVRDPAGAQFTISQFTPPEGY